MQKNSVFPLALWLTLLAVGILAIITWSETAVLANSAPQATSDPSALFTNVNEIKGFAVPDGQSTTRFQIGNAGTNPLYWSIFETFSSSSPLYNNRRPGDSNYLSPDLAADLVTITHSVDQTIQTGNSFSCQTGENRFLRLFNLNDFGITTAFAVVEVEIAIEEAFSADGIPQLASINLYTLEGPLLYDNLALIGTADILVEDQFMNTLTVPVNGIALPGATLVVEFLTPDTINVLFVGANDSGQTGPSYWASADCDQPEPVDLADIEHPDMHLVLNVTGIPGKLGKACTIVNDLPWLSLSPFRGTTAAGEKSTIEVNFDAAGMREGIYQGSICIASSDPKENLLELPVTLLIEEQLFVYLPIIRGK